MQKIASGSGYCLSVPYGQRGRRSPFTKILLVMKLTALLLTVFFLQVHAEGAAQNVTISGKDIPLKQVFTAIKQQTGYVVFYNKEILENTKPVTLAAYNLPLQELLQLVFKNQPVSFTIQEKTIILSPESAMQPAFDRIIIEAPAINGHIIDIDNQAIANVSIRVRGTNRGTITNASGGFSLDVKEGEVLEISAVGYDPIAIRLSGDKFVTEQTSPRQKNAEKVKNQESQLVAPGKQSLVIRMVQANSELDQVVIIPYGQTSRRFTTGNITSVKAKDIERQPVMNVLHALEGRVPGMNITNISGNSAAPVRVEIRGRTSLNKGAMVEPLYIIDGIPQNTLEISPRGTTITSATAGLSSGAAQAGMVNTPGESPLLFLNPRDIESVEVLKDADATAIYGSRGANGVILITTKKAKSGPTTFSMSITNGIQMVPRRIDLMNTEEYLAVRREAYKNNKSEPDRYGAPDLTIWDQNRYTDWQRELIGTGNMLSIDAGISGGGAQTSYRISANYRSNRPLMNNGGKNIVSGFLVSLNHSSQNQKFKVRVSSNVALSDINAYALGDLISLPPNAPAIYDEKGDFNFEPYRGSISSEFPFSGLKRPSESKSTSLRNNINISYELIRGLVLSASAGYNFTQNNNILFNPLAAQDKAYFHRSTTSFGHSQNKDWTVEPQLQYRTMIGKGHLSAQIGASILQTKANGSSILGAEFPNDNMMRSINNANPLYTTASDSWGEYKYNAVFSILNFRWDNKYVINLSARRDGSSRFGPGNQFGNFGSVGLAWIASEEKWMKTVLPNWISTLKFRSSYGVTGKDGGQDYGYIVRWGNTTALKQRMWDYIGTPGFVISSSINPEYSWEASKPFEAAADVSLFKDRVTVNLVWYQNRSGKQLTNIPTPQYSGFPSVMANWDAVVQNRGLEIGLSATLIKSKDWNVSVGGNISRNRNKLHQYPGFEKSPFTTTYILGKSLSTIYLFRYTGIDPLTGFFTFEDRNKDGQLSSGVGASNVSPTDDRSIEIDRADKYYGGFVINATYKNFDLTMSFAFKRQPYGIDPFITQVVGSKYNFPLPADIRDNHWQQIGDNARYPQYMAVGSPGNIAASDAAYTDASYLRMQSLSMSYSLPAKWLSKINMKGCQLSCNTNNLFVITSYKGIDPEIQTLSGTPVPRTITMALSFNF